MKKTAVATGISFFCIMLSLSAYMLHWRVENEPGASSLPVLIVLHYVLLAVGASSLIALTITSARRGSLTPGRILMPVLLAVLCYLPILVITLLMMA